MQDVIINEDGTAEFICQYSRPVQASWKKNDEEVCADGQRVVIEQDWNVAKLRIKPALPQDTGIYSCEAGGTKVVAMLDVQGEAFHGGKKIMYLKRAFTAATDRGQQTASFFYGRQRFLLDTSWSQNCGAVDCRWERESNFFQKKGLANKIFGR